MHADFHITCFLYLTYLQNLKFVPQISILNSFFGIFPIRYWSMKLLCFKR